MKQIIHQLKELQGLQEGMWGKFPQMEKREKATHDYQNHNRITINEGIG